MSSLQIAAINSNTNEERLPSVRPERGEAPGNENAEKCFALEWIKAPEGDRNSIWREKGKGGNLKMPPLKCNLQFAEKTFPSL